MSEVELGKGSAYALSRLVFSFFGRLKNLQNHPTSIGIGLVLQTVSGRTMGASVTGKG